MPKVKHRNIAQICAMVLLITGCSGPEEATTPAFEQQASALPRYDQRDGDIYMYVAELSEGEKAQGMSAAVLSFRYLGAEGDVERLETVDDNGERISIFECSNPCAVSKVIHNDGTIVRQAVNPSSILAAVFQDAFDGNLLPTTATKSEVLPEKIQEETVGFTPRDTAQSLQVYRGEIVYPDFKGREKDYAFYRTKITTEMKSGPNFAGRYAVVVIGCGTECTWVTLADVSTGELFGFPYGGEADRRLDLSYSVKSRDINARWINDNGCMEDFLAWDGAEFVSQNKRRIGDETACNS